VRAGAGDGFATEGAAGAREGVIPFVRMGFGGTEVAGEDGGGGRLGVITAAGVFPVGPTVIQAPPTVEGAAGCVS
jgi:hypothetical protein